MTFVYSKALRVAPWDVRPNAMSFVRNLRMPAPASGGSGCGGARQWACTCTTLTRAARAVRVRAERNRRHCRTDSEAAMNRATKPLNLPVDSRPHRHAAAVLANGGRDIAIHGKRNGLYCASRVGMHTNGVLRGYVCCYHE